MPEDMIAHLERVLLYLAAFMVVRLYWSVVIFAVITGRLLSPCLPCSILLMGMECFLS